MKREAYKLILKSSVGKCECKLEESQITLQSLTYKLVSFYCVLNGLNDRMAMQDLIKKLQELEAEGGI